MSEVPQVLVEAWARMLCILMSCHGTAAEAALDLLSKESQLASRVLREIAQDLVDEARGNGDP